MSLYKIKLWKEIVKNHNKSKESKETKSINTDFTENNSNEYKKQINKLTKYEKSHNHRRWHNRIKYSLEAF